MTKVIKSSSGHEFLVDDEDYSWLRFYSWCSDGRGYAITNTINSRKKTTVKMHRVILDAKYFEIVDHINGNPSDNRKSNLRTTTQSKNTKNQKVSRVNNTSGYKGVNWDKSKNKWMAKITVDYKAIYLGRFDCKEDAARAYNDAATRYFGEFAKLNQIA